MIENKKKIIIYHFVLLFFFVVTFVAGIAIGIIKSNWSYLSTVFLNIPFMSAAKLVYLAIGKQIDKKEHYSKKKEVVTKMVLLHIASNILMVLPFTITCIVFFLTDGKQSGNLVTIANNSTNLNLWICVVFMIGMSIAWVLIHVSLSVAKMKKEQKLKQQTNDNIVALNENHDNQSTIIQEDE